MLGNLRSFGVSESHITNVYVLFDYCTSEQQAAGPGRKIKSAGKRAHPMREQYGALRVVPRR